ncbi:MAG: Gfo/Idh/MocA family oxidoreductase [Bifidobacteriaceae bacterium]|jgi:predicted dehydrogenase|nr:Gfo/Idh/MocA family oxidoreductase [Bifidobacteriaceae bacterium]
MRFGVVGTGAISDWFVAACRQAGGTPVAVSSRDSAKGREFAARHGLEAATVGVERLARMDDLDAIYVASPIGAHFDHVVTALEAGKHVLCEKTLARSPAQVEALFAKAEDNRRVLLEAVRPVHDPAYELIRAAVRRLGVIRWAHFEMCQYSSRYPAYRRGLAPRALDPASGNSALRDLGVYCIHPCLELFAEPLDVFGASYTLDNGFEAGGNALLSYDAMTVTCAWSKVTQSTGGSFIQGEDASLMIDHVANPARVDLVTTAGASQPVLDGLPKQARDTLHHEISAFIRLCRSGDVRHRFRRGSIAAERIIHRLETRPPSAQAA